MRLIFKQRFFSWFDSYDIYNEHGETVFTVKGQLSWGHCLKIFDANENEIGTVKERIFSFLPKFEMYLGDTLVGSIKKDFTFFKPAYTIECRNWQVDGDFFEWDYTVKTSSGALVATVSKELFKLTDTYVIDVWDENDAIYALMLVLAIDAEKCSRE